MSERLWNHLRRRLGHDRPIQVVAYRGYGTPQKLRLSGRVLEGQPLPEPTDQDSLWQNLAAMYSRLESDELIGAAIRGVCAGDTQRAETNRNGYFDLCWTPRVPLADTLWQPAEVQVDGHDEIRAFGEILVPMPTTRFGVVSDIDDTILKSFVGNPLRLAQVTLLGNARTRLPFPGAARFYQALHAEQNPVFYVSGSLWNFYDLLTDFMDLHGFPQGPLVLRDLEFGTVRPLLRGEHSLAPHKQQAIEAILECYPDLPLVLIGDSGQKDPEIYAEIVARFPGRILAIYIRDVTAAERDTAVLQLADRVAVLGSELCYVTDTAEAARHAAARGLIPPEALSAIQAECDQDRARAELL